MRKDSDRLSDIASTISEELSECFVMDRSVKTENVMKDDCTEPARDTCPRQCQDFCNEREQRIAADVFNPNETDREYYERRLRELKSTPTRDEPGMPRY